MNENIKTEITAVRQLDSNDAAAYQKVRRHALMDVPQFVGTLAEQDTLSEIEQLQSRMDNDESEGVYRFGYFLNQECVGVAAFTRNLNPKYSHKVFFWGLYILPHYRGRSIGTHLMEHRISLAQTLKGVRFAMLQVTTTNKPARALHARYGFVSWGIEPQALNLNGTFYDVEMMQLDLTKVVQPDN
jgi:ribosomal protein S18 acetylase RimI-like enzyme